MKNLEQMHKLAREDRNTYREMIAFEREQIEKLEAAKEATTTPEETVKAFIASSSYSDAVATIANLVNRSAWDGRISPLNAGWASAYATLAEDVMVDKGLYTKIHMTHLDQIADAMRAYIPEDADDQTTADEAGEPTIDEVREAVCELSEGELVEAFNAQMEAEDNLDDQVFSMDEFEDLQYGVDRLEIARMCFYGNFNPNDDWFGYNGYGNLVSFGYAERLLDRIDRDELAEAYINNPDAFRYTALGEALER